MNRSFSLLDACNRMSLSSAPAPAAVAITRVILRQVFRAFSGEKPMIYRKLCEVLVVFALLAVSGSKSALAAPAITVVSSSIDASAPLYQGYPGLADQYGCNATGTPEISPQLSWSDYPRSARYFVVLVYDPDAPDGTFYHWGVYNIPKKTSSLPENSGNMTGGGLKQTINDFGSKGYKGPCPPEMHHYYFTVYALKAKITLAGKTTAKQLKTALAKQYKKQVVAKGTLVAVYPYDEGTACESNGATYTCQSSEERCRCNTQQDCTNNGWIWDCSGQKCQCYTTAKDQCLEQGHKWACQIIGGVDTNCHCEL